MTLSRSWTIYRHVSFGCLARPTDIGLPHPPIAVENPHHATIREKKPTLPDVIANLRPCSDRIVVRGNGFYDCVLSSPHVRPTHASCYCSVSPSTLQLSHLLADRITKIVIE